MKNTFSQIGWKLAVVAAVIVAPLQARAAAAEPAKPAAAKAAPKEPEPVKSVFATDPKKGKDPFYPKSERWNPPPKIEVVKTPGNTTPAPPPPKKDPYKHFSLRGFVGSGNNRVVTVSSGVRNYIVVLGESKMANTPEGPHRFKIVRYTESGVVIQIEGFEKEEKELKLPTP